MKRIPDPWWKLAGPRFPLCTHCGAELLDDGEECQVCGYPVAGVPQFDTLRERDDFYEERDHGQMDD